MNMDKIIIQRNSFTCLRFFLFAGLLFNPLMTITAAPGKLVDAPLFTVNSTPPNVFFEMDDSGSMDLSTIIINHWDDCLYNKDAVGDPGNHACAVNFRIESARTVAWNGNSFGWPGYTYRNGDDIYRSTCAAFNNCPATQGTIPDWRVYSSDFNLLYFNPAVDYHPWKGTGLIDADFKKVRSNPQPGSSGYTQQRDLTGFIYEKWTDTHGYSGTKPARGKNINRTAGGNNELDYWDEHRRYTVLANSIKVEDISYSPPNSGTLSENVTLVATLSGAGSHGELNGKTIKQVQQDIANWYQYSRRRSFVTKSAVSNVIMENPKYRFGLSVINRHAQVFTEVPAKNANRPDHNKALLNNFFDLKWPPFSTPLRQGLKRVGNYYDNTDGRVDPITEQCQQNFAVLLTDGFWNGTNPQVGDRDSDSLSNTLADVAKLYYDRDLSPLSNVVPANQFDPATYQHMVTYTVAFGKSGFLTDTDNDGWPGNAPGLSESDNWGDPLSNIRSARIDDLWHAAYNGHGRYISATTPEAVTNALSAALANIGDRIGSASSVSFNSTSLSTDTAVFLGAFANSNGNWTGDLLSYSINPQNAVLIQPPNWSAADQLDALINPVTDRSIITYDGLNGIPFQWHQLLATQQDDLRIEPNGSVGTDAIAESRLNYLRGDRSEENANGGNLRDRSKLLGDIINSAPVYVGKPQANWPAKPPFPTTASYTGFANGMSRDAVVYTGANDGMLHGFDAITGAEVLAYIPNTLFSSSSASSGLHYLTDQAYSHRYFVDMPSVVEDAYFDTGTGDAWHTVLVGGSRAGGKGIFALDVTQPNQFSEANAARIALWEFDNSDDADMGFSFSKPTIAMMNNGRWAAIFGNGYNNDGDGQSKLFILFLDGGIDGVWTPGNDYIELSTGVGSPGSKNGLSTPQTADIDRDHVVDRVYAGDLAGNLWAFDLSDTNPRSWGVAYSGNPLFIAGNPITSKPAIAVHPTLPGGSAPNLLVTFGTGQFLVTNDITDTSVQSFYGVWDHGVDSLTSSDLVEQTFLSGNFFNDNVNVSSKFSVLTDNPVDYQGGADGWFIKLTQNSGERVTVDAQILFDTVFFNTWIPESSACSAGGSGVLMSVDLVTGGRTKNPIFDLNGDNKVDAADFLNDGGTPPTAYAASGERVESGLPSASSFMSNYQFTSNTGNLTTDERKIGFFQQGLGRDAWQELR